MNIYNAYIDPKPGVKDLEFAQAIQSFLGKMQEENKIAGWRLMRRKLGLGPRELGDFHLMIETDTLAQLDEAFSTIATRNEPTESLHHAVNSKVGQVTFALYRDFPDAERQTGEEKF